MWVRSMSWEDPLGKEIATHSSIPAWANYMDRGAWWATVHGVTKESGMTEQLNNKKRSVAYMHHIFFFRMSVQGP